MVFMMNSLDNIHTYREFSSTVSFRYRIRNLLRNMIIVTRSFNHQISNSTNWIRMVCYHHVFDDERSDFERQLNYLRNFGEFISIDQVYDFVKGNEPIDGRYFCITFDDGFRNTHTNMMPITGVLGIPVIIYLPTGFIDPDTDDPEVLSRLRKFAPKNNKLLPFLGWEECKEMQKHQISFGSHSVTHPMLSQLDYEGVDFQLTKSKKVIEEKLGTPCRHFAVPKGRIGIDFDPVVTEEIAKKCGYHTVVSLGRGKIQKGDNVYLLNREHLIAKWGNPQIKYFFGKS